jgi:hypothetical protein
MMTDVLFVLRVLLIATATILFLSCSPCDIEHRQTVTDPTSGVIAEVVVENCHATAPFVFVVNVRCRDCDFSIDDYVASFTGTDDVNLRWEGDRTLVVRYRGSPGVKAYRRQMHFQGVTIRYEEIAGAGS